MLAGLIATLGITAWAFAARSPPGDPGDGAAGAGADAARAGPPAATAPPAGDRTGRSPSPRPTVTATVTATPQPTPSGSAHYAGKPCRDVGVRLGTSANKKAYGPGDKPKLTVRVEPKQRCVLDPDNVDLVLTSGPEEIWSARDCSPGDRPTWTAGPDHPFTITVRWQRVQSNPARCGKKGPAVGSGWYTAEATLGNERSNEAVLRLK